MRSAMAALPSLSLLHKPYPFNLRRPAPFFFFFFPSSSSPSTQKSWKSPLNSTRRLTTLSSSPPPPLSPCLPPPSSSSKTIDLEPYLACSMPGRRLKIALLLSGGVDSSIALRLLHAAGHSCTAFYLKIWFHEDFENFWSECPWDEDLKYARAVCDQVDVPLEVVHLSDEYWNNVVSHIIGEYRCGRTPNPDILCNTRVKFGAFLESIKIREFNYIASGHYAHVVHSTSDQLNAPSVLLLSKDMVKDQTYFLSHLSQSQLRQLLFPLGCIPKEEVRKLASLMALPNKDRKDSQGICFLGKVKFSEFVEKHIGEMEGVLLEAETGDYLGKHRGFWFYTQGQRQGLRLPGGPWYVVEKDVQNNVVFVSRNYFSLDKRRRKFCVGSLKWFNGSPPANNDKLRCKVKDQTYFLSHLSQSQLRQLLFPLGCIPKEEVRKLASLMALPNKDRKDSQGICFLGKVKFSEFVEKHIGEMEGVLLEAETGDYLGKHRGFWFYTQGQRQGLRLPGGPWYVVEKDVQNNVVFVSRNYFSLDKRRRKFRVGSLKWFNGSPPANNDKLRCKVRHGPAFYDCTINMVVHEGDHEEVMVVHLSEDDQGLAAGQFAAFYHDEICMGSGVILESWGDSSELF